MKFRLFGVDFEYSFLFAAALALFIAVDKTGHILPLLLAILLHESGHLIALYAVGTPPKAVRLVPGCFQIVSRHIPTDRNEMLVLAAGPVANLICFFACYRMQATTRFAVMNLLLFIYNMLPVEGLDGGSMLRLLIVKLFGHKAASVVLTFSGIFCGFSFFCFFFYLYVNGTVNYSVIIFSIYLLLPYIFKILG